MVGMDNFSKTDVPGLVRDERTKALVNRDHEGLKAYKARKNKFRKIDVLERKISNLEEEISFLKNKINTFEKLLGKQNVDHET